MYKLLKQFLLICLLILVTNYPTNAQDSDSTGSGKKLLKLSLKDLMSVEVVTASRKSEKYSEASANVIVITDETIKRRGYMTLTEVFEDLPGFDFTIKQPAGEYSSQVIFRGLTDAGQTKILLMVDGIVVNDISNGWLTSVSYDMPVSDIERIELISGPGSSLYGANAYAGLINVITKTPFDQTDKKYFLNADLTFGEYNTISPQIFAGYKFDNGLSMQLAARLYKTDGDRGNGRPDPGNYFHNNYEPDSVLTSEYGNIPNEKYNGRTKKIPDGFGNDINNFSIRGKLNKEGFTLGFSFYNRKEGLGSSLVGYEYFTNTPGIDYQVQFGGYTIFTTYESQLADNIFSKTLLYHRNTYEDPSSGFVYTYKFQSVDNGIDPPVRDKKKAYSGEGTENRLEQQVNVEISENNNMVLGFLIERRNEQYYGISLGPEQDPNSSIVESTFDTEEKTVQPVYYINNAALYFHDEFILDNRYKITAGLRYDYNTGTGGILNPRFAFVGSPVKNLTAKILYGHAYKAPTVFELFDEWHGNADLKPQGIKTLELELRYFLNDNLSLMGNYYYSKLDNLINISENPDPTAVPIGPNGEHETYYQNVGSTNLSGYTFTINHHPTADLSYSLNYTTTLGEDGSNIDNTARHKINIACNYLLWNKLNINLRGNYVGKVKAPLINQYFYKKTDASIAQVGYDYITAENPDGFLPDHFIVNLTLRGVNLFEGDLNLEPEIIIRNLFDTDYYTAGRQLIMGLRPVNEIQTSIQNPEGYNPAYHPQPGREIVFRLRYKL